MAARYTNLPNKNINTDVQSSETKTKRLFNGYFTQTVNINSTEWDIVFSFFKKITKNDDSAYSLTEATMTSAINQNIKAVDIIRQMDQFTEIEIDKVLAMYFNSTRRNTSLIGYTQELTPNKYISRNILA